MEDLELTNLTELEWYQLSRVNEVAREWYFIQGLALDTQSKEVSTKIRKSLFELNSSLKNAGIEPKGEITEWDREYLDLEAKGSK
jgi:hypothetical protein